MKMPPMTPFLVFFNGSLLSPSSYRLNLSPIEPTQGILDVIKDAALPEHVLELLRSVDGRSDLTAEEQAKLSPMVIGVTIATQQGRQIPMFYLLNITQIRTFTPNAERN